MRRRPYLVVVGTTVATAIAGCAGNDGDSERETAAESSTSTELATIGTWADDAVDEIEAAQAMMARFQAIPDAYGVVAFERRAESADALLARWDEDVTPAAASLEGSTVDCIVEGERRSVDAETVSGTLDELRGVVESVVAVSVRIADAGADPTGLDASLSEILEDVFVDGNAALAKAQRSFPDGCR